jgi:hypothetical protein
MKTNSIAILFLIVFFNVKAQQVDTLSNLSPAATLITRQHIGPNTWGYWTGHNSYGDEEWAEKYYINGQAQVLGLGFVAIGNYQNATNKVRLHVKQVNANRLPGQTLGFVDLRYDQLQLNQNLQFISFTNPILVSDSFFVSFDLGDISHGGFEGDTIAMMMGEDGSRIMSDAANFGRNAIKWHSHVTANWKDFATQNFTPIMTHFALFPIVSQVPLNLIESAQQKIFGNIYPNPVQDEFYIPFQLSEFNSFETYLYDFSGNLVQQNQHKNIASIGAVNLNVAHLKSGIYYLKIRSDHHVSIQKLFKL